MQHQMPDLFHGGERLDVATFNIGFEYMKTNKPRLIHFGFGDTDEFAHAGEYDYYLDAAQKTDARIRKIWEYIQSSPQYANKTTLIITTDHGRGAAAEGNWKHHGSEISGADQIWIAAIGPSVLPAGESRKKDQVYQGQVAATIAQMVGKEFKTDHPVLPALKLD
jgi:arylsulfatase A-like enzyme